MGGRKVVNRPAGEQLWKISVQRRHIFKTWRCADGGSNGTGTVDLHGELLLYEYRLQVAKTRPTRLRTRLEAFAFTSYHITYKNQATSMTLSKGVLKMSNRIVMEVVFVK
jgi:hypothetical protein